MIADIERVEMDKCDDGFWLSGANSAFHFDSNLIRRNDTRGILVRNQATVTAKCNKLYKNGGCHTGSPARYGAVGWDNNATMGTITLGGTSGTGSNHIAGNRGRAGSSPYDVEIDNYRSTNIDASNNFWANSPGDIHDEPADINEPVDTDPVLLTDPMTTPSGNPTCPNVPVPTNSPTGDCTTN